MQVKSGFVCSIIKKAIAVCCLLFFIATNPAMAQPPVKDPSNPEMPELPTQYPPGQFYDVLKDKNADNNPNNKTIGSDKNKSLKDVRNVRSALHIVCQWGSVQSLEFLLKLNCAFLFIFC